MMTSIEFCNLQNKTSVKAKIIYFLQQNATFGSPDINMIGIYKKETNFLCYSEYKFNQSLKTNLHRVN
jgi:hypothetical protein